MAQVTHTVEWYYGSYSGTTEVRVDENANNDAIRRAVKRKLELNFLAMCSEGYKVVKTVRDPDEDEDPEDEY